MVAQISQNNTDKYRRWWETASVRATRQFRSEKANFKIALPAMILNCGKQRAPEATYYDPETNSMSKR